MQRLQNRTAKIVEGPRVLSVTKTYAPDWSWSEYIGYKPDGSISQKIVTTYNPNGDETSVSIFNGAGKLLSKKTFVYKDGRMSEGSDFNGDGVLVQKRVLVWGEGSAGIIEVAYYDGKGALIKREVNTRDMQAKKSVWTTYRADGSVAEEATHDLNYGGTKKTQIVRYNVDGTVESTYISTSDASARDLEKVESNADGTPRRKMSETREYDANRNLSKITDKRWNEQTGQYEPVSVSYYTIVYQQD